MIPIERIAARGEGVAQDGRHIRFALPGDSVDAQGRVVPGAHHAVPPCRHFPDCGGCQLQHADDQSYAEYLKDRISYALASHGVNGVDIRPAVLSPPRTRRRASLQVQRRGRNVLLGFNEESSHRIVDMHECHVLLPELFALAKPLRRLLAGVMTEGSRGKVGLTRVDQGIDVSISGLNFDGIDAVEALISFAQANSLARLSVDEGFGSAPRYAPETVTVTLGGIAVQFPENGFLQATFDGEAALVDAVRSALPIEGTIADLFAGLGTFALSLPGRILAFEGSRDATLALQAARRVEAHHRDLYRNPVSVGDLAQFDGVVLDPPRAGAKEQIGQLAGSSVPAIAYVSCNPSTFARDARALIDGGYALDWVRPVGQFRWATHVELVGAFRR